MVKSSEDFYTSRIIKATALITDTKNLLLHWRPSQSVEDNLARIKQENLLGKSARSRVDDILRIFRRRYLRDQGVISALHEFVEANLESQALNRILYYHAAHADKLLYDVVAKFLVDFRVKGRLEITTEDFDAQVTAWNEAELMTSVWSEKTIRTVAKNISATLRDFGILEGAHNKRIATPYLPISTFCYIAFMLKRQGLAGHQIVNHPDWSLYLMQTDSIERLFIEAHQQHFLEYHAAGSIIRIEFPASSLEAYANAIVQRAT